MPFPFRTVGNPGPLGSVLTSDSSLPGGIGWEYQSTLNVLNNGVKGNGTTNDLVALQAAADAATANNQVLLLPPLDYNIGTGTLTLKCNVNAYPGSRLLSSAPTEVSAVVLGDNSVLRLIKNMVLPEVIQTNQIWSAGNLKTDTGIEVRGIYCTDFTIPHVKAFSIGLLEAPNAIGELYNTFRIQWLENNAVNHKIAPLGGGSVNENKYFFDRYNIDSGMGSNITGCRHIQIIKGAGTAPDNLTFFGGSIERDGPEFQIEVTGGRYIRFVQLRYESSPPKVKWGAGTLHCIIDGGYQAETITFPSPDPTALYNELRAFGSTWVSEASAANGVIVLRNAFSNNASAITLLDTGADIWNGDHSTDYSWQFAAGKLSGKARTDAANRIVIDNTSGRYYIGSGGVAPTKYIQEESGNQIGFANSGLGFSNDNTYDIGAPAARRPRDVYVGRDLYPQGAIAHTGTTFGVFSKAPATQGATPVTLADCIALFQRYGLCP